MNKVTSVRLNAEVGHQLDVASKKLHRGKNWIINQAIKDYLAALTISALAKEAKRQSLLASNKPDPDDELWENNSDTEDWQ